MRERHNIVGTEVGRPRLPFYTRPGAPLGKRRSPIGLIGVTAAALLLIALGGMMGLRAVGAG